MTQERIAILEKHFDNISELTRNELKELNTGIDEIIKLEKIEKIIDERDTRTLVFLFNRLRNFYKENESIDYMQNLKQIINKITLTK